MELKSPKIVILGKKNYVLEQWNASNATTNNFRQYLLCVMSTNTCNSTIGMDRIAPVRLFMAINATGIAKNRNFRLLIVFFEF